MNFQIDFSNLSQSQRRVCSQLPNQAGVYILYKETDKQVLKPMYVGQSYNVKNRVRSHQDKVWDRASFIPVSDKEERLNLEKYLITAMTPEINRHILEEKSSQELFNVDIRIEEVEKRRAMLKIATTISNGKGEFPSHKLKEKCLAKGIVNNKQSFYNKLDELVESGDIENITPEKKRYLKYKLKSRD